MTRDTLPSDKARQRVKLYYQDKAQRDTVRDMQPPPVVDTVAVVRSELDRYLDHIDKLNTAVCALEWAVERIDNYRKQCELDLMTDTDELWDWVELLTDKARKTVEAANAKL